VIGEIRLIGVNRSFERTTMAVAVFAGRHERHGGRRGASRIWRSRVDLARELPAGYPAAARGGAC
jgi:hypothetical protein